MGMVALKCPNCGADISINESKDFGFCEYCGTKVMQEKIVVEHRIDESGKYDNLIKLADHAYSGKNYGEAYDYYTKAMEIKQEAGTVIFRKAICAGYLSNCGERNSEVTSGVREAFSSASDDEKSAFRSEIIGLVTDFPLSQPSVFYGVEACENYINRLLGHVSLAEKLYLYTDTEDKNVVGSYCRSVINFCNTLKLSYKYERIKNEQKKYNINLSLNGLNVKTGDDNNTMTYTTPQNVIQEIGRIRKFFIDESNKFISGEAGAIKEELNALKQDVKGLPIVLQILHGAFSLPMVIAAAVLLLIKPGAGLILLAAELICFIVFGKLDSDGKARALFDEITANRDMLMQKNKQLKKK